MEKNGNTQVHNGKTNGYGGDTSVTDNPFVSPRPAKNAGESIKPQTEAAAARAAELPPVAAGQKKNPKHNALIFSLTVLLLACVGLGLYAIFGGRKSIDYRVADKQKAKPGERSQSGTGMEEKSATSQATAEAIHQAKEELRKAGAPASPEAAPTATPIGATDGPRADRASTGQVFTPFIIPEASSISSTGKETGQSGNESTSGRPAIGARSGTREGGPTNRSSSVPAAYSLYVVAPESRGTAFAPIAPALMRTPLAERQTNGGNGGIAVPSFGAMLPVRTLGALYTLRQGSLARFELTRDMSGDGWALKRGTVLVAEQQGSEHDRAFLTLMGFIDPETNRLVRLSGDLLGGDAAPGLKGKRRRISSRWTGVFNRVANSAVALGQAALSRGNSTTIITPGTAGLGNEFGLSQSTLARREFVEVPAGAPAYVLVTDLPRETRGIDAEPVRANGDDFLADEELAELLASGNPEQIRAALPRMQPEMRRVALLVLGEKDK